MLTSILSKYSGKILVSIFIVSMMFINPWIRGDGVGYYAYIRSLIIDHDLNFENEYLAGNKTFLQHVTDEEGNLKDSMRTATGLVENHWAIGPAILWSPFILFVHLLVILSNKIWLSIPANGFSAPYTVTMALFTALYGFLGVYLSFRLASKYFSQSAAFLGTLGIWLASSLPVYMYFNPSWSHAHSAFAVALFLWYWDRTRDGRSLIQWVLLGLISGLIINVYYINGIFLLIPLLESIRCYYCSWRKKQLTKARKLFLSNSFFTLSTIVALLPTFITKQIIYGRVWETGYSGWFWTSPKFLKVLFSSEHGLLTWTPVLIPALIGFYYLAIKEKELAIYLSITFFAFLYVIASYHSWHGISSFGNRFFVSFTPAFVLGLTAFINSLLNIWEKITSKVIPVVLLFLIIWNFMFIFQWGTNMVPNRGSISWKEMVYNQVFVVPGKIINTAKDYLFEKDWLMRKIEKEDLKEIQKKMNK